MVGECSGGWRLVFVIAVVALAEEEDRVLVEIFRVRLTEGRLVFIADRVGIESGDVITEGRGGVTSLSRVAAPVKGVLAAGLGSERWYVRRGES